MRLIDADALMDKHRKEERERYGGTFVVGDNRFMQRFMDAPTVDAVQVVRCKDCKECEERHTANYLPFLYCKLNQHGVLHNAFCCWAERREDETD